MIIDIPYIQKILKATNNEEAIKYFVNHYFDYICEHVNIQTTLEEQQISLENLEDPIENPNFNDDLTLFQETLIFAIACNLSTTGISVPYISQEIYDKYITFFDVQELVLNEFTNQYSLTYCDLFQNCLKRLDNSLMLSTEVSYVRRLLGIAADAIEDKEIEFLIEHYKDYLSAIIPNVDTESALFKQAIYLSIACHLFKTRPEIVTAPIMYYVDEVRERFKLDFDKYGNTWCDLANAAINDLKKKSFGYYGLRAYDRPGARTKYGAYGPSGRV